VHINHLSTTCNTCESQFKYCGCRSLCACYLSLFIATLIAWKAHTCRWGRPRHCIKRLLYSWRASRHGHKAVDSLHQSSQNQHFAAIYTESRQTFVWGFVCMLTIVTAFFVSCFNICSDVLNGQHGHGASSDYKWRRRPVDMEGSCVCFEYRDANNRQGVFCDSVFKELRE